MLSDKQIVGVVLKCVQGVKSMSTKEQTEDLKAFEQRLTEIVTHVEGSTYKWRILLVIIGLWIAVSVWMLLVDDNDYSNIWEQLWTHKSVPISIMFLAAFYLSGGVDKSQAARVITKRCRNVLQHYNMSCDDKGKLILKRTARQALDYWRELPT